MNVKNQVRKVINASGRMSILGVSIIDKSVMRAMEEGASQFYIMEELHQEAGKLVAAHVQTEEAFIINSASAGIALSVAGLITREKANLVQQLFNVEVFPKREILLMKGHHVDYGAPVGTMIETGGGVVREVGYANGCTTEQIAAAVTESTAGILFIQSHHCVQKNMPTIKAVSQLAEELELPLLIDIAAEEEFISYSDYADIVILSGSKALEGPTSGVVAGKAHLIEAIRAHQHGIGRAMKIGKEGIFGILQALHNYELSSGLSKATQLERLEPLGRLTEHNGITVKLYQDDAGREIYRLRLYMEKDVAALSAEELTVRLKAGNPAIYTRDYYANTGFLEIDPRSITVEDAEVIAITIGRLLNETA